jgi:single-strand DNA-binding protein
MANETNVTIVGYLTADPELKSTSTGLAVVNLTIASTPSKFDKATNQFVDGETLFMRATAWRTFAEQIAASLRKGDKVIALGRMLAESYNDKEGNKRTSTKLELDSLGLDLSRPPKAQGYSSVPQSNVTAANFTPPSSWVEVSTPQMADESPF